MEEVIKEIKQAEENAESLINEATRRANEINADLDGELALLKTEYEEKLRSDSLTVLNAAKARMTQLRNEEDQAAKEREARIRSGANAKLALCADFVYGYIVKEYNK